jgi:hypothetical protein
MGDPGVYDMASYPAQHFGVNQTGGGRVGATTNLSRDRYGHEARMRARL